MPIRQERHEDWQAIRMVVESAFGQVDEADLVDRLRTDGDCVLSLVAIDEEAIVGMRYSRA